MNEEPAPGVEKPTAGRLLREAREKQGLHIAALAASIKVTPKKLESLESDRFDELPDATFARALAQTVCRALKIDAAPIMRLLPPLAGHRLEQVGEGLNMPFRDRPGLLVQNDWQAFAVNPWAWVVVLILIAAAAVYLLPGHWIEVGMERLRPSAPTAASSVVEPGMPPEQGETAASGADATLPVTHQAVMAETPKAPPDERASEPAAIAASAATGVAAASAASSVRTSSTGMLQFRSTGPSWIGVIDGQGKTLISRVVAPGETIGVDGAPPFKLTIGNASATHVVLRGQTVALDAFTRDNVARLELR